MAGIKIINVLKHDTFADIVEVFRRAPAGEVILVLPRNGKAFGSEQHFEALAAEASGSGKVISVLASDPQMNQWARKMGFVVMNAGQKPMKPRKKPAASLATAPPPSDDDIQDPNEDASDTESRNVVPSDETMEPVVSGSDEDIENLGSFHVEEQPATTAEGDADLAAAILAAAPVRTRAARPSDAGVNIKVRSAEPEPARPPVPRAAQHISPVQQDLDYIDRVWRDKAGSSASVADISTARPRTWPRLFGGGESSRHAASSRTSKWFIRGVSVAAVVVLAIAVYLTTGSAIIAIFPSVTTLDERVQVQASDAFSAVDSTFGKIPGQLLTVTRTASATAAASAQRDVASKARGRITVANEYSSTPQTLVATTRFATPDGLVFRTLQTVTVPGSTVQEGKPVAGTVDVDVIADKPGSDYNVGAGRFTIVAFVEKGDTERAERIYGTSREPMSGGAIGPSKVVTQEDYDNAEAEATALVKQQIRDALSEQASGMRVLDEVVATVERTESTARIDDAADAVKVSVTATLRTVAFRQADFERLLVESVMKKDRLVIVPGQLSVSYADVQFEADTGVLNFTAGFKGPGYAPVDTEAITRDIQGMDARRIHEYFTNREGIESADIELKPFWVSSVPSRPDRIHLTVENRTAGESAAD